MAHFLTIHQLLEQLRAGELSSREATQACLDRVETVSYTHLTLPTKA